MIKPNDLEIGLDIDDGLLTVSLRWVKKNGDVYTSSFIGSYSQPLTLLADEMAKAVAKRDAEGE